MFEDHSQRKHSTVRRPFTIEEDALLMDIMSHQDFLSWDHVSNQIPGRTTRQCRERWVNYLSPNIRNDPWTEAEDQLLLDKINELGRCWSNIGRFFDGRSENDVKNRWYSHLKYKVKEDENGKCQFITDPSESPYPERKKRNRTKVCPQKNAMRMLEQRRIAQQFCQHFHLQQQMQMFMQPQMQVSQPPKPAPVQTPPQPTFVDYWDRSFIDEFADATIESLNLGSISLTNGFLFD